MAMLLEDLNFILRHRKALSIEQDQIALGKGDEDRLGRRRVSAAGFLNQ
ncbi:MULTISPECIES: hypothetical protein [unclassified Mesorhizobium]|nr:MULTISPECIES: hypothetical protein [unclassified Mesorhizobium]MBZ9700839.1 hypothetical protein [Mesorhizobium sp. CO1-1-3]MBZ9946775.1 hypothetical protein [Mesorhizobium sp. BR1-1-11]